MSAAALAAELGVSLATLHRMLPALGEQLVSRGAARRRRYALRREALHGQLVGDLPIYAIDTAGRAHALGTLALLRPQGSCLITPLATAEAMSSAAWQAWGWPLPDADARDGWWGGLPYPLYDMRPQGYLGRQFARAEAAALGVAPNPEAWGDEDIAWVLAQRGEDCSGQLILGRASLARWQAARLDDAAAEASVLAEADQLPAYARLADEAVARGVAGSSAAGEFPKFPARRALAGAATPHVLVKFSGADGSPAVQRWADLLVCEHLAGQVAAARLPGVKAAASRLLRDPPAGQTSQASPGGGGGRTYLEVERFDRHGLHGRSGLLSLATLDAALVGSRDSRWEVVAARLAALGLVDAQDLRAIRLLAWFGRLIANTDMHGGNLSFCPMDGRLVLAPVYDMLPMAYAPLAGGEVPALVEPPRPAAPAPEEAGLWQVAAAAAQDFWQQAADDRRISAGMRQLAGDWVSALQRLRALV